MAHSQRAVLNERSLGVASKHHLRHHSSPLQTSATMHRKVPFLIRVVIWFAALASAGMCLSILLVVLKIGPTMMGGERVTRDEWLHIAAPLVAVIGILMSGISYGFA